MGNSPSDKWEDGVLVERAIPTNEPGDPVEDPDFVSGSKPYKTPEPTEPRLGVKRVRNEKAEDKAVKKAATK